MTFSTLRQIAPLRVLRLVWRCSPPLFQATAACPPQSAITQERSAINAAASLNGW